MSHDIPSDQSDENASVSPGAPPIVHDFPGRIVDGKCNRCDADVSYIIEAFQGGKIKKPSNCPDCGVELLGTDTALTEMRWRCGKCRELIVDIDKQKNCTGCGARIIIPDNPDEQD